MPVIQTMKVGNNEVKKQKRELKNDFHGVFHISIKKKIFFLQCQLTDLAKYLRHAWSLFGANIS